MSNGFGSDIMKFIEFFLFGAFVVSDFKGFLYVLSDFFSV